MSLSRTTQSYCSEAMIGTASARGIGVTRLTHCEASHGVNTGSEAIGRCLSPASSA